LVSGKEAGITARFLSKTGRDSTVKIKDPTVTSVF
jgi:hypothetical protein